MESLFSDLFNRLAIWNQCEDSILDNYETLLFFDNCSAHPPEILINSNIDVMHCPLCVILVIYPCDQVVYISVNSKCKRLS